MLVCPGSSLIGSVVVVPAPPPQQEDGDNVPNCPGCIKRNWRGQVVILSIDSGKMGEGGASLLFRRRKKSHGKRSKRHFLFLLFLFSQHPFHLFSLLSLFPHSPPPLPSNLLLKQETTAPLTSDPRNSAPRSAPARLRADSRPTPSRFATTSRGEREERVFNLFSSLRRPFLTQKNNHHLPPLPLSKKKKKGAGPAASSSSTTKDPPGAPPPTAARTASAPSRPTETATSAGASNPAASQTASATRRALASLWAS